MHITKKYRIHINKSTVYILLIMRGVIQLVGPHISRKFTEDYTCCLHEKCIIRNKSNYTGNDSKRKIYILGDQRVGNCEKTSSYEHVFNSNY